LNELFCGTKTIVSDKGDATINAARKQLNFTIMKEPKDLLSKEDLNLVTGGISPGGILACSDSSGPMMGTSCDAGCKRGCVPGCRPGCSSGCVLISGKDGYAK
jgi:hypothetical protein